MKKPDILWLMIILTITAVLAGSVVFSLHPATAQTQTASSDAIAVRVVPNPNHYSIARWYEAQGFSGSPQSLIVDGYEAIRDGRTVYVAAANIETDTRLIHTNIYLISYNQDPAPNTVDILGQMIAHWKFNDNLPAETVAPTCAISSLSCASDTDCAEDQHCAPASAGAAAASCQLDTAKNCLTDTDCPANFFCDSLKAKITRDVKRVGRLEELKESLYSFKQINKRYPYLSAGTYLAGRTISVWPSWSQSFLPEIASSQSFLDPINRLGACSGYDAKTCWDENAKKFVNTISSPASNELPTLPAGSYAFAYAADTNGSNYKLCAVLESRAPSLQYRFSTNDPADTGITNCTTAGVGSIGNAGNTAPKLIESSLVGEAGKEFNGFIKFTDAENNPLSWSLVKNGTWNGWQGGPVLENTSNPYQKKVHATLGGAPGTYSFSVAVSDGLTTTNETMTATILGQAPFIEAADAEYVLDPVNPFTYHFNFSGLHLGNPNINTPVVTKTGGAKDILSSPILVATGSNSKTFSQIGDNKYRIDYQGLISPALFKSNNDLPFGYNIKVTDGYGNVASKNFKIILKVEKPLLDPACPLTVRAGHYYSCVLGAAKQGNHSIDYSVAVLPSWLSISGQTLSGTSDPIATTTSISLIATNEYGAMTTKNFVLKTNSYCGDGVKQSPNTEGRGGIYNDGYEDCDGTDGIIATPKGSNIDRQYGCSAGASGETAIFSNNYCIFKSPLDGGGYCGDGYCQMEIGGQAMENCKTCQEDCGNCIATIESYTRDEQIAYFNGTRIYSSAWPDLGTAARKLLTGNNLFAFWPHSLTTAKEEHGLVYRILVGPPSDPYDIIDPTNSTMKCAKVPDDKHVFSGGKSASGYEPSSELINSGYRWTENGFTTDSSFVAASILPYDTMGNVHLSQVNIAGASTAAAYLPYVWGVPGNFATSSAYYCRLDYDYALGNLGVCRPRCNGVICGTSNGCPGGGTCASGSGCCQKSCGNKCPGMANCAISGTITDYLTDDKLSGASVVLKDIDGNILASATTAADGAYSFSVISAEKNYTITISKSGYDNAQKVFYPNENKANLDFTLAPAGYSGAKKFKLTWGASPVDVDSHLEFGNYSIYYGKCNRQNLDQVSIDACESTEKAILDKDDLDSYGPENIRIVGYQSGTTYHYYVVDYSGVPMGNCDFSNVQVKVYGEDNARTHTFSAAGGKGGNVCYWCVANVDSSGNVTVPSVTYGVSVSGGICSGKAACIPSCAGKCGGSDGCGGTCPDTCGTSKICTQADCANVCGGDQGPNNCGRCEYNFPVTGGSCYRGKVCPPGCYGIICGNTTCQGCYGYRDDSGYICSNKTSLCYTPTTGPKTGIESCCTIDDLRADNYTKCPGLAP